MLGHLRCAATVTAILLVGTTTGAFQERSGMPPLVLESVAGRDNFERYCASCHGRDGRGEGPVAPMLKTRPADLTVLAQRSGGSFPRARVAAFVSGTGRDIEAHGPSEMPVWGPIFRGLDPSDVRVKQRIDNLVAYIESLQMPSTGARR